VVRTLTIVDGIDLMIIEQVSNIVRSICFILYIWIQSDAEEQSSLYIRFGDYPKSRSRLGLTFDYVCVRRKTN
jgi:hypothetical protein